MHHKKTGIVIFIRANPTPLRTIVFFGYVISALITVALNGCTTGGNASHQSALGYSQYNRADIKVPVSAIFGPDGRLWRVISTDDRVFVDVSKDYGKSFSTPVMVNPERVPIRARSEYRAQIMVDSNNRIYVAYPASGLQPWTTYLSYSVDQGRHFSPPEPLSDRARVANSFEAALVLDAENRLYAFWHDERESASEESGNSIYYSVLDSTGKLPAANRKLVDGVCSCCRLAAGIDTDGQAVLLFRNIYSGNIRDLELMKAKTNGNRWTATRASRDEWQIEACPTHGPALAIDADGIYHMAWFTQGSIRKGIFYARSTNQGRDFSTPMPIGDGSRKLPGHPDVISLGQRVVLTWSEFDGAKTQIRIQQSKDGGQRWSQAATIAESASESDFPHLLTDGQKIFLSWNSQLEGYRLIPID